MAYRSLALLLCAPLLSVAQFSNLATTTNGDRLFFVTPLRQPGLHQFPHDKLFLLGPGPAGAASLALVFQEAWTGGPFYYSGFAPINVSASADGHYVAFTTITGCQGGSSCYLRELAHGLVLDTGSGQKIFGGNRMRVSRNGEYVSSSPSPGSITSPMVEVVNRSTNETHSFRFGSVVGLSLAGDVLLAGNGTQLISWDGKTRDIPVVGAIAMDDAATVVLSFTGYDQPRLFAYDIASGARWQIGPGDRPSYSPTLSDNGQWVLYVTKLGDTAQLILSHPDGSGWKQVTNDSSGIREGVLSGDARVAWASTTDGRLLKISTDNLETNEV